jgi:hypothetical protein
MTKKRISLFLGNGINLLDQSAASWRDVLSDLAQFAGKPEIMDGAEHKPFTLIYEEVIAALPEPDLKTAEREVKEKVAKAVGQIPSNSYHKKFENLGFKHILTTNYDYNIGKDGKAANLRPESRYSVFRRRKNGDQSFWMLHGEIDKPDTIMLGHDQYAGAIQKIRAYVTSQEQGPGGYSSPFLAGVYNFDNSKHVYSWVDVLLRDNVHILGFSLEYTEIELWWILAYKARLKRLNDQNMGKTYYYLFSQNRHNPKIRAKIALLKSLEVEVYVREVKKREYRSHFDWALKRLARLI